MLRFSNTSFNREKVLTPRHIEVAYICSKAYILGDMQCFTGYLSV